MIAVSTVSSLYDLAHSYLQAIVAAMATTEAGEPARAFVAPEEPAFDTSCDQAAVWIPTLTEGQTSPSSPPEVTGNRVARGRINLVALTGYAVRCAEVSEGNQGLYQPLQDTTLNAQAKQVYEDGWAIWNYLTTLIRNDQLFGGPCGIVHFDLGTPYANEGGLMGWQTNLRVELGGYRPDTTGFPPVLPSDQVA